MTNAVANAIVYRAVNRVNGHSYIGYTARGLKVRKYQHLFVARKGGGNHFHRAIRKHGEENFVFEIMGEFGDDEDLAKVYEIEAIAKYRPEYNLSYGGEGGTMHESTRAKIAEANSRRVYTDEMRKNAGDAQRGKKRSDETREKLRVAGLGRKHTPETIEKMRVVCGHEVTAEARAKMSAKRKGRESPAKGKKWSVEARQKVSLARKGKPSPLKGRPLTEEHKANIREAGKLHPPSREKRSKPVRCLNDGRVLRSTGEADRFYGFPKNTISKVASGQHKSTRGMRFVYEVPKSL